VDDAAPEPLKHEAAMPPQISEGGTAPVRVAEQLAAARKYLQ
jgi:hypothetical protein